MRQRAAALQNIVLVSIWQTVRKLLFYSNSDEIFYEPNKHNPFSGHRAYNAVLKLSFCKQYSTKYSVLILYAIGLGRW